MDLVRQEKLDMAIVDTTDRDRTLHFRKLTQRNFSVALPLGHPLAKCDRISPQSLSKEPQVAFHYNIESSFGLWASGISPEERVVCTVNTAQAALDLVSAGVGVCVLSDDCILAQPDVCFVPLENWHQALYMCILYDKWLEPSVWDFVEIVVQGFRQRKNI